MTADLILQGVAETYGFNLAWFAFAACALHGSIARIPFFVTIFVGVKKLAHGRDVTVFVANVCVIKMRCTLLKSDKATSLWCQAFY